MAKKKSSSNKVELLFIAAFLILLFALWETPFLYPIKLFIVLVHESSHALAAIISGGKISDMEIGFNLGGSIKTSGGNEILIASAGYLGSLVYGLLLFSAAALRVKGRWIIFLIALTLCFPIVICKPGLTYFTLGLITLFLLIVSGFFISKKIVALITKIFALSSCIYVLYDLKTDLFSKEIVINDSTVLSNLIGINHLLIGIIWLASSVVSIIVVIKLAYFRK